MDDEAIATQDCCTVEPEPQAASRLAAATSATAAARENQEVFMCQVFPEKRGKEEKGGEKIAPEF